MRQYYIYILTNYTKTTLYIGITNNIGNRVLQHRNEVNKGFTSKYKLKHLIYLEEYNDVYEAIEREKQLKKWNREWKDELINEFNPKWEDLSEGWYE